MKHKLQSKETLIIEEIVDWVIDNLEKVATKKGMSQKILEKMLRDENANVNIIFSTIGIIVRYLARKGYLKTEREKLQKWQDYTHK